MQLERI
ncbi:unnamed protein product [Linum tenue]|nr:unnamed protein product [Linum tenue]